MGIPCKKFTVKDIVFLAIMAALLVLCGSVAMPLMSVSLFGLRNLGTAIFYGIFGTIALMKVPKPGALSLLGFFNAAILLMMSPVMFFTTVCSAIAAEAVALALFKSYDREGAILLGACLLYTLFGLGRVSVQCLAMFLPIGGVFALSSFLLQRDWVIAGQMGCRVLLVGVSAVPVVTLPPIALTRCLRQLSCPRMLTLGMLIAIRFVPVIAQEVVRVREAMRARGAGFSLYRAFVVPVMVRIINISETMALGLETRAFSLGSEPASIAQPVVFRVRDGLYCTGCVLLLFGLGVVLWTAPLG